MQAFATQVHEVIKINNIEPRFYNNPKGWVVEFDFPHTRQHNAMVDAAIDRANIIITEFLELKEFALESSSLIGNTPVRARNVGSVAYLPLSPWAAARGPKAWPSAKDEAEEATLLENFEEERIAARRMQEHTQTLSWAAVKTLAQVEQKEAEEAALIEAAQAKKLASRQKAAEARLAKAENENAALLAAAMKAEEEVARQQEERASRGAPRPVRGPGSRGGKASTSVDRGSAANTTPQHLESMAGNVKKASAVKTPSIPRESTVATPVKKKAAAKAMVPKSAAATKTTAARGGITKANNSNWTSRKRAPKKQGEVAFAEQQQKKKKKKGEASQASTMTLGQDGRNGEGAKASVEFGEGFHDQMTIDNTIQNRKAMVPMKTEAMKHNEMGEQFEQLIRENAFDFVNAEHTGLGIGIDALLTLDEDKAEQLEPEELVALLTGNRCEGEEEAMSDIFGNGAEHSRQDENFEPMFDENTSEMGNRDQAKNPDNFEAILGENTFEIGNGEQIENRNDFEAMLAENTFETGNDGEQVENPERFKAMLGENTFEIDNAELGGNCGIMEVGSTIMDSIAEQPSEPAKTDGSLSEDQFWDAEAGSIDGFEALLGENTYDIDMGERGGNGGQMDYMFQNDFEGGSSANLAAELEQ
jgi:hypothetical protein